MNLTQETKNEVLICKVEGEINMESSVELRKAFDGFIRLGAGKILLDLEAVSYVDSSGLATLIELLQRLKKTAGRLRIANMSAKVKSVFEITKLSTLFEIFQSTEAALKEF